MLKGWWRMGQKATYHLLVGEHGAVVDQRHAVGSAAAITHTGLSNAATVYLHPGRVGAQLALEEGLLHLRNQLGCPDHHATDSDELVDVCKGREAGSPTRPMSPAQPMCPLAGPCQGRFGPATKSRTTPGDAEEPGMAEVKAGACPGALSLA